MTAHAPPESAARLDFIKALAQAVSVVSLYGGAHAVSAAALQNCWAAAQRLLALMGRDRLILTLDDDARLPEGSRHLLGRHGLRGLTLSAGLRPHELAGFCEALSSPPEATPGESLEDLLEQRGVRHILPHSKAAGDACEAAPAAPPPPAPRPPQPRRSFSSLLKELVESSVSESDERAHVYEEALALVKEALERQVAEATSQIKAEKQRVLHEQMRTESMLAAVADGKVVVDKEGRVLMMNPAAEDISGRPLAEMAGKPIAENLKSAEHLVALSCDLGDASKEPSPGPVRVTADGETRQALRKSIALVHDESGRVVGTCVVLPGAAKYNEYAGLQKDFVCRVTHELKAPLTALIAALEIVAEKTAGTLAADVSGFLAGCGRNAERLRATIDEILDFSSLQTGKMEVRPAPTPVEPALAEAVEALVPWAQRRQIDLRRAPPRSPPVMADGKRLVQILTNLIANAIKCTPAGGRVTVSVEEGRGPRQGSAVFSVRDTGCGIAERDKERVFQEFVRGGNAPPGEGIGLGLAIVRELVGLHGGEVWLESSPGKGATFFFTIPLAQGSPRQAAL